MKRQGPPKAKMNNGKAEVVLEKSKGDDPGREIVMQNLKVLASAIQRWLPDVEEQTRGI